MENNKDMSISFTKWEEDGEVGYEATLGADNSSGRPLLLSEVMCPNRMRFLFAAFEIKVCCRFG